MNQDSKNTNQDQDKDLVPALNSAVNPSTSAAPGQPSPEQGLPQLRLLNDREHVQKRAGTYIGDLGVRGLHHLVHEVIDNSLDEAMAGHADEISAAVHPDGSITIADNGRGIPIDFDPQIGTSALEGVMTRLKYGGKFDDQLYESAGGLNGMGMKAVNFLSQWCIVQVDRQGHTYQQTYKSGVATAPVEKIGELIAGQSTGTRVSFLPDPHQFKGNQFQFDILRQRLQTAAFLNRGIKINFSDQRCQFEESFQYDRGIVQWVEHRHLDQNVLHPDVLFVQATIDNITVEVAFQYNLETEHQISCFANNIHNEEGGVHQNGFHQSIARCLSAYGKRSKLFGNSKPVSADYREGLTAIVSVRLSQPQFESQHKIKLTTPEVEKVVQTVVSKYFNEYLEEHPDVAKAIIRKAMIAAQARLQAKEMRKRLTVFKGIGGIPGKLRDCTSRIPEQRELYLVEGDSAGGSAEGGRVRQFQAILPLRGKIINAFKYTSEKVLANNEVQSIIQALGANVGDRFEIEKLQYHKVIIMSDADVDGSHIRTLLLTFFYRQMPGLISNGHVYIAQPPLYRVRSRKTNVYVQTDEEMKQRLLERGLESTTLVHESGIEWSSDKVQELSELSIHVQRIESGLRKRGFDLESPIEKCYPKEQQSLQLIRDAAVELKVKLADFGPDPRAGAETTRFEVHNKDRRYPLDRLTQLNDVIRTIGEQGIQITRFKGLGEMNAEELRVTTLLPELRSLTRVTMHDAARASQMFHLLMGVDVEPRRKFIETQALHVRNLDV